MRNNIVYIVITVILSLVSFSIGWQMHQPTPIPKEIPIISELTTYVSGLGFSFDYPKDMTIIDGSDGADDTFRVLIVPSSYKNDNNQNLTAVVISASPNNPPRTPLEWLKDPNAGGADMSKGYNVLDIGGQEAISLNESNWIVVDTPDNARQISIATLPGENPSQSLRDEMAGIVRSFIFTNF